MAGRGALQGILLARHTSGPCGFVVAGRCRLPPRLAGKWWAAVPREKWPQDQESIDFILEQWDDNVGDARQELVMIGMEMDQAALTAKLEACLLTDAEMAQGPMGWARMADPFPGWE
jgi:G3E family GTPase